MPQGARLPATNFCSVYSGRDTTPTVGSPFRSLIQRLQVPRLLLQCLTCHAVVGSFVQPGLEGSSSLLHLFNNKSSQEHSYCETEVRLASSLDFWTLSSENLIGTRGNSWAVLLTSGCVSDTRGCSELCEIVCYLVMLSLLVASPGDTEECTGLVPDKKIFP